MADEDPVDQIVRSLGHHPDDGRNGETEQQGRNTGLPELCRTIHADADYCASEKECNEADQREAGFAGKRLHAIALLY